MPRSAGRRDEILATFVRHVAERGYERTNLGDIAAELGMSKGTIVHHFGTKAQLLRELEETYMARQLAAVRLMWERLERPQERIAGIVFAAALLQVTARDETVASQREVRQLADDPVMLQVRALRADLQRLTTAEIERGIAEGVFRAVDARLAVLQLFGASQWMWVWFSPDGPSTPEQVGAAFVDVHLGGLLADRFELPVLAAPDGPVVQVVRECLATVAKD